MAVVAVLFCVAISMVISAPCANVDKLTVKVAVVVPLLPSTTVTSAIERFGVAPPAQLLFGDEELRGDGVAAKKSLPF